MMQAYATAVVNSLCIADNGSVPSDYVLQKSL